MPTITVIKDIDTSENHPLKGVAPEKIITVQAPITIGTLSAGMESGKTSVAIIIPNEDGTFLFIETSLVLVKNAFAFLNEIPE